IMARELADAVHESCATESSLRVIVPCGPASWYAPFARIVNDEGISLRHVEVFHMDECLDWQGRMLPLSHPYSFQGTMRREFYDPINPVLSIPEHNRHWMTPGTIAEIERDLAARPADLVYGGWGQDG